MKKESFQFLCEDSGVAGGAKLRMSTGRLFHARGADTLNARSTNFSLVHAAWYGQLFITGLQTWSIQSISKYSTCAEQLADCRLALSLEF